MELPTYKFCKKGIQLHFNDRTVTGLVLGRIPKKELQEHVTLKFIRTSPSGFQPSFELHAFKKKGCCIYFKGVKDIPLGAYAIELRCALSVLTKHCNVKCEDGVITKTPMLLECGFSAFSLDQEAFKISYEIEMNPSCIDDYSSGAILEQTIKKCASILEITENPEDISQCIEDMKKKAKIIMSQNIKLLEGLKTYKGPFETSKKLDTIATLHFSLQIQNTQNEWKIHKMQQLLQKITKFYMPFSKDEQIAKPITDFEFEADVFIRYTDMLVNDKDGFSTHPLDKSEHPTSYISPLIHFTEYGDSKYDEKTKTMKIKSQYFQYGNAEDYLDKQMNKLCQHSEDLQNIHGVDESFDTLIDHVTNGMTQIYNVYKATNTWDSVTDHDNVFKMLDAWKTKDKYLPKMLDAVFEDKESTKLALAEACEYFFKINDVSNFEDKESTKLRLAEAREYFFKINDASFDTYTTGPVILFCFLAQKGFQELARVGVSSGKTGRYGADLYLTIRKKRIYLCIGENMQIRNLSRGNDCETLASDLAVILRILYKLAKDALNEPALSWTNKKIASLLLLTNSMHARVDLGEVPGGGHGWVEFFDFNEKDDALNFEFLLTSLNSIQIKINEKTSENWYQNCKLFANIRHRYGEATSPSCTSFTYFVSYRSIGVLLFALQCIVENPKVKEAFNQTTSTTLSQNKYVPKTATLKL